MTFAATCDWTLLRSLALALAAWPLCVVIERGLKAAPQRKIYLALVVLPFLVPELLLAYLIAPFAVGRPWRAELACDAILLIRCVPVGVLALWISPPSSISRAAIHIARLSLRGPLELLRCYWHGPIRRALPSVGLMFLVNFQEFEAAALLGAVSWTDRLFTEHAVYGLAPAASLRLLVRPLAIQLAVLAAMAWSFFRRPDSGDVFDREVDIVSPGQIAAAKALSMGWCLVGLVLPLVLLSRELLSGWTWLVQQPAAVSNLMIELSTAALVGLVAGLFAWNVAQFLWSIAAREPEALARPSRSAFLAGASGSPNSTPVMDRPPLPNPLPHGGEGTMSKTGVPRNALVALTCLPGLCGALTVSLFVLRLKTWPAMRPLSSTPAWWALAATIWLLPRAVLMHGWLAARTEPASMHLLSLLRSCADADQRRWAAEKWWQWRVEPQIAAVGVLCYWAYLDLTSASLLAPPGMASVVTRLYNFMHYGHSEGMTVEGTVAMLVPVLAWGTILLAVRAARSVR